MHKADEIHMCQTLHELMEDSYWEEFYKGYHEEYAIGIAL